MKKILFLAYPVEKMKPNKDTSLELIKGALACKHEVHLAYPENLELLANKCYCDTQSLGSEGSSVKALESFPQKNLDDFDQVWVRMDPPFNRSYFYSTLQLDFTSAQVINSPRALRDWNEKLSALFFESYGPKTIITNKASSIESFAKKHDRITMKPIDGFGGKGISFSSVKDPDFLEKIKVATHNSSHKIVAQEYLPDASKGDLRVLIWKGEVLGGILRVHAQGNEINNLDAGGQAIDSELSSKQKEVSQIVADELLKAGILFAGIDFLGDKLTEINVTSPTGLFELSKFKGTNFAEYIFRD